MADYSIFLRFKENMKILIETGTWLGDGISNALKSGYEKVYSCDIDITMVENSKNKYKGYNVEVLNDNSVSALEKILKNIDEKCLIYLDAHVMPTGKVNFEFSDHHLRLSEEFNSKICPIIEELEVVSRHHIKNHTIVIDDLHCFGTWMFEGLTETDVEKYVKENINQSYSVERVGNALCFYI
jgi:hypothetical protein